MSRQKFIGKGDLAMRPESVGLTYPRAPREDQIRGCVAVIQIRGPLEHHGGWWFESYDSLLGRVEGAMQHEDVSTVLLDIDSPGGEVSGLQEAVRSIRKMRSEYDKPIIAFANDEAYSAAYALACSADEIYLPEGGGVGSIGVLAEIQDLTGMAEKAGVRVEVVRSGNRKAEGHPFIPLNDGTIGRVQARVDDLADQFFALVSDVRPTNPRKLESLQGACLYGQAAVDAGLADAVASFDEVLSSFLEDSFDNSSGSPVLFNPTDRLVDGDEAMSFKVLEKKVAAALMALNDTSLSAAARKKAVAAYAAAQTALTEAKVKKTYEKKTTETETEEDDGEKDPPEDDDDDEDEKAAASAVEDDEDEEKADDSKEGKKASSLAAFVKSLTGQSSTLAAQQVLASMHEQAQQNAVNSAEIKKLKDAAVASERKAIVSSMVAAGQLKPAQLAWAETQPIASLKSFAKHTPAMFAPRPAPVDESVGHASGDAQGPDGLTDFERKLCAEQGIKPESFKATRDGGATLFPKVN